MCCLVLLFGIGITGHSQRYTESFTSSPAFTAYPGVPSWTQTATVILGGTSYEFVNAGNGGWAYKTTGGNGNSANLLYSTAATTNVTIKRTDGARFQFYGAWLKYTNASGGYTPPWLSVSYTGSSVADEIFSANSTVTLVKDVSVTRVVLNFSGLLDLNFDDIIVGPASPVVATVTTNTSAIPYTQNSATLGGNVTDDGSAAVTDRGIVYSTTNNTPTVADNKVSIGSGTGSFSASVTGLAPGTIYYYRSFAINSVGTSYGSVVSFTTLSPFQIAGTHTFNSVSWGSTTNQPNPYTKLNVEGWDITAAATNGTVGVLRVTSTSAGEGLASVRTNSSTTGESLTSMRLKTTNGDAFSLKSFIFRYATKVANTSFGIITVTGYRNGSVVNGAVQSLTGVSPVSVSTAYNTFTIPDTNTNFQNIDEIRLSAADPVNAARLNYFDFDVLTTEAAATSLPLTLTSFKAYEDNNDVRVLWSTTSEINFDKFDIERSKDGFDFKKIGTVKAKGLFPTSDYAWLDVTPGNGINFYRLRMVDKDGSFQFSVVARLGSQAEEVVKITPNPVVGRTLGIALQKIKPDEYDFEVFDINGKLMHTQKVSVQGGSSFLRIVLPESLKNGIYTIRIKSPSHAYTKNFILK